MSKKILVLITCYNNDDEVIEYVKDLSRQTVVDSIQIVVTVNNVKNIAEFKDRILAVHPSIKLEFPGKNLGYLFGCLNGLKSINNIEDYEWVLISNTDITFENEHCLQYLLENKTNPETWVIAPMVTLPSGRQQNPFLSERPSSTKILFWQIVQGNTIPLYLYSSLANVKNRLKKNLLCNMEDRNIYAAHGSCFFVKPECAKEVQKHFGDLFMYGEELLIAEIARNNKKLIKYFPDVKVLHNENSTTKHINYKRKAIFYRQSYRYIYNNFFKVKT